MIKGVITAYGTSLGDYRENVAGWITSCLNVGGLPMFRTRYAGLRWDGDRVLVVCYAKANEVPGGFLEDVPREDLGMMERGVGDFRPILDKYGTPSQRAVLAKYKPPRVGIIKWIAEQVEAKQDGRKITVELVDRKTGVVTLRKFLSPREFDKFREEYKAGRWPDLDWRIGY